MTLEALIDRAVAAGNFYGITIFTDRTGTGPTVNLLRDISTAVVGQCVDPSVSASQRLRILLEANLSAPTPANFDDLLG